jgi:hypothetical protein
MDGLAIEQRVQMHVFGDCVGDAESRTEETAKGKVWHSARKARWDERGG